MQSPRVLLAEPVPNRAAAQINNSWDPPPLGLASLAAYLLQAGIEVEIFDGGREPSYQALEARLLRFAPTHFGITAYTRQISAAAECAAFVKRRHPGMITLVGGPHATAIPDRTLQEFPSFDLAVHGEGEESLLALLRSGPAPDALRGVAGIAFRAGREIVVTSARPVLDINALPSPAWHLFDLPAYSGSGFVNAGRTSGEREFMVQVGRGCPFHCTFCSHILDFNPVKRDIHRVLAECVDLVERYGATRIIFANPTFTADRQYVGALCRAMIDTGLSGRLRWHCSTRIDMLDRELLMAMKQAGCELLGLGLESGTQGVLDSVGKGFTLEDIERGVAEIRASGIISSANFILGLPGETRETILRTIDFALGLELDFATFSVFIPLPGSELVRSMEAEGGHRILSHRWEDYDTQTGASLIQRDGLSAAALTRLHFLAYLRFYLRRGYFLKPLQIVDVSSVAGSVLRRLTRGPFRRRR